MNNRRDDKEINNKMNTELSSIHRKLTRRGFLYKIATVSAAFIATILINPVGGLNSAFAHGYACSPPNGTYCSSCKSNGDCPSGYLTCTNSTTQCYNSGWCVYATGWWYSGSSDGTKGHVCRDCVLDIIGPIDCDDGGYMCGCRSTTHYN